MSYVFDSSSLIYLGKLRVLEKIGKLEGKKFIPKSVYKEVVTKGFERKEPEAYYIDILIKNKIFIIKTADAFGSIPFLSEADNEVLALAKETKSIAVIDEIYARSIAESYGIDNHGTIYIILKLMKREIITKREAINYLDRMISLGFYLSSEKYKEIMKMIEKFSKK